MEKEILEILKAMQQDIKGLKESQERLENKIDGVVEQTADLLEFRTKITDTVQNDGVAKGIEQYVYID